MGLKKGNNATDKQARERIKRIHLSGVDDNTPGLQHFTDCNIQGLCRAAKGCAYPGAGNQYAAAGAGRPGYDDAGYQVGGL